jgi:hypothetical protein
VRDSRSAIKATDLDGELAIAAARRYRQTGRSVRRMMMADLVDVGSGGSLLVMLVSDHLVRLGGEVVRGESVLDFVVVDEGDDVGNFPNSICCPSAISCAAIMPGAWFHILATKGFIP